MRIATAIRPLLLSLPVVLAGAAAAQQPPAQQTPNRPPPNTLEPSKSLTSMADLDLNKDGFIDKSEVPSGHELAGKFARLDRNSDGKLDASEFAAYQDEKR
ncbi:MAG: EF-hand domain-containing protein [Xanthomonadaceae bacterium]|nr:EF-hand domain-containing protein [Xanthomonadaceae bacterium]ODU34069.1 MAG: hypothetical protein ABS97_10555 [Xanthomonadaceae bacterium SCN 69-320]